MIRLTHPGTELVVDDDGRVHVDGHVMALDRRTVRRLAMVVDPVRLRSLGAAVGVGPETTTLTVEGVTLTIRHRGALSSVARSVLAPLETLLALADIARDRGSLELWTARLPLPIETENLVIRFHTYEPRVHDATDRNRWTSLFADGKCLRFDDASIDDRGRLTATKTVPRLVVVRIATLVEQLGFPRGVDGTYEHDEDRNIAVVVQRPDAKTGALVASRWSWSAWAGAEQACRDRIEAAYAPGEHALVYALYELLVGLA